MEMIRVHPKHHTAHVHELCSESGVCMYIMCSVLECIVPCQHSLSCVCVAMGAETGPRQVAGVQLLVCLCRCSEGSHLETLLVETSVEWHSKSMSLVDVYLSTVTCEAWEPDTTSP